MDTTGIAVSPSILIIIAEGDLSKTLPWVKDLEAAGYSCIRLSSRPAQMSHVSRLKIDLVLLDSTISDEFNGETDVYDKLVNIPAVHIVSPDALSRVKAFAAGAVDCIVKPVAAEELLTRVRTQFALRALQKQLDLRNMQFATTLENIGQGVCFFDAQQRLILSNRRYAEVYGLAPEAIRPAMTLSEITDLRYAVGACPAVAHDEYLAWCDAVNSSTSPQNWSVELKSGKVIRIHHERTPDGGWVSTHEDVTEHRDAERQIAHLALHDPLTDLPNRAALKEQLHSLLVVHGAQGSEFAVLCLDLDRFKEINDVFGHHLGDVLLRAVADRLQNVADGAFVARLGGDEFMLLMEGDAHSAAELADHIVGVFNEDMEIDGNRMRVGTSIGVAMFPTDGDTDVKLMGNADAALYRAKADGRGTARFFEPEMDQRLREKRALQRDLHVAIAQQQLAVFYQPQAATAGEVVGFEALLRWQHPTRGSVSPSVFIPIAEEGSLMIEIGEWVLREACREAASWPRPLKVAINLSPVQFKHGDLPGLVHSVLLDTGLSPDRLELEITEGVLIDDFHRALSILRRLKALGVHIAMDDFGTGYSSLSYLQAFPFDKIKIDQSFVRNISQSQSAAIIRAVIGLGRGLDLPVIAEGVESKDQLAFLAQEMCDQVQGYLVGRPYPISEYAALVGREPASSRLQVRS
ncbi:EAL domain-containing protein [Rhizobium sp. TRM95111]|uniref:two-component system response regulator n=1 Tax=Rhizobium alarense TaxID=2846851 RepID=UPI001F1BB6BD|nr:EAL domain-containing protein [Rhizobium alarense]MCF3642746.1 EAL domain-containing protein [Rhizobium alarense]